MNIKQAVYLERLNYPTSPCINDKVDTVTPPRPHLLTPTDSTASSNAVSLPIVSVAALRRITELEIALGEEKKHNEDLRRQVDVFRSEASHRSESSNAPFISCHTGVLQEKALSNQMMQVQAALKEAQHKAKLLEARCDTIRVTADSELHEAQTKLQRQAMHLQDLQDELVILRDILKLSQHRMRDTLSESNKLNSINASHCDKQPSCRGCRTNVLLWKLRQECTQVPQCPVEHYVFTRSDKHELMKLKEEIVRMEKESCDTKIQLEKMTTAYATLQASWKEKEEQYHTVINDLQKEKGRYAIQVEELQESLGDAREQEKHLKSTLDHQNNELHGSYANVQTLDNELKNLREQLETYTKHVRGSEDLENREVTLQREQSKLYKEQLDLQQAKDEIEKQQRFLREEKEDMLIQATELDRARHWVLSHTSRRRTNLTVTETPVVKLELLNERRDKQEQQELQRRLNISLAVQETLKEQLLTAQKLAISTHPIELTRTIDPECLTPKHEPQAVQNTSKSLFGEPPGDSFLVPHPVERYLKLTPHREHSTNVTNSVGLSGSRHRHKRDSAKNGSTDFIPNHNKKNSTDLSSQLPPQFIADVRPSKCPKLQGSFSSSNSPDGTD